MDKSSQPADSRIRDSLAAERTHLANERTLLAYVRTALALAGGGALLLHFFPDQTALFLSAWVLLLGGALLLIFGGLRFVQVGRRIHRSDS